MRSRAGSGPAASSSLVYSGPASSANRLSCTSPYTVSMHAATASTDSWPGSDGGTSRLSSASTNAKPRVPRAMTDSTRFSPSSRSLVNTRSAWCCSVRPPSSQSSTSDTRAMHSSGAAAWFHRARAIRQTPASIASCSHIAASTTASLGTTRARSASRASGSRCSPRADSSASSTPGCMRRPTSGASGGHASLADADSDTPPSPHSNDSSAGPPMSSVTCAAGPPRPPAGRTYQRRYGRHAPRTPSTASAPMRVDWNDSWPSGLNETPLMPLVLQDLVSASHHPTVSGVLPSTTLLASKGSVNPSGGGSSSERNVNGSAPAGGMGYGTRCTWLDSGVTGRTVHVATLRAGGGRDSRSA
mmetsp:Transcript_38645/g.114819  ORF Transcript_38645/g.114819 Transcript_38645/m.114819 type:complete len:358 (+) Transcript_38645:332-1405(+)